MLRNNRWLTAGLLASAVLLAIITYLASAESFGFPLDDAWIHQTYAINLAQSGRWEFFPGTASSGSTAPLYMLLLALGYRLTIPFPIWTTLLGALSLFWLGAMVLRLWQQLWPQQAAFGWVAGLAAVLLWPLVWSAVSGMETLLFTALALTILSITLNQPTTALHLIMLGSLLGLLILTRPDGSLLALLVALALFSQPGSVMERVSRVTLVTLSAVTLLLPYFWFNWRVSGTLWPNTLYAKQVEYAALRSRPWWNRIITHFWFSLGGAETGWRGISGAQLLLLPGIMRAGWQSVRQDGRARHLHLALPLLWAIGHVTLYALRLPVTYQHGRYLIPVLPIWLLYGLAGWRLLLNGSGRTRWIATRVIGGTFALLILIFWLLGARAYQKDVAFIEHEMVAAARWVAANTPPDAMIAAHDVGALGYFAPRPLVDLGGLTDSAVVDLWGSPAEIDLIWTADYLMTAPGWPYSAVTLHPPAQPLFTTAYPPTRAAGLNNIELYYLP